LEHPFDSVHKTFVASQIMPSWTSNDAGFQSLKAFSGYFIIQVKWTLSLFFGTFFFLPWKKLEVSMRKV